MRKMNGAILLACFLLTQPSIGDEIYRVIDADGHVTYTDTPPPGNPNVERMDLPPAPSAASQQHTEDRIRRLQDAARQAEMQREQEQQKKQARIATAQTQLAEAEARLTEAKELKDEDRQNLAGGKRRIRPDYFERVKEAEVAVEEARKALRAARGY